MTPEELKARTIAAVADFETRHRVGYVPERVALEEHARDQVMDGERYVAACPVCGFESEEALKHWTCHRCGAAWGREGCRDPKPAGGVS